ncbi:MAG: Gmad2 immunoglobulin-like domain-containing protein [Candidatus Pacebacteria bacterium]|nr:Gmad2 immunoglobulin-like domain-containing protein [Candidatus Paceibacterota bacterium]
MAKKIVLTTILIIVAIGIVILAIRFLSGPEDTWLCQGGIWIKHGNPKEPMPSVICGPVSLNDNHDTAASTEPNSTSSATSSLSNKSGSIIVEYPKPNQEVAIPFSIKGKSSTFEGNVLFEIKDKDGQSLIKGCFMGGSMGEAPFEKMVEYLNQEPGSSDVVLEVSDESAKDGTLDSVAIPLKLTNEKFTVVKLYFSAQENGGDCKYVTPMEIVVPRVSKIATQAMSLLLGGVPCGRTDIFSNINYGTKVQKLTIADGVARIDFNEKLEEGVGGSCKVAAIRAQITETLKQFYSVEQVIISINGRTEDILQP